MDTPQHVIIWTVVGTVVAWLLMFPLIWLALAIGQHRRAKAREITAVHDAARGYGSGVRPVARIADLDGVDVTRFLDREDRNGGTL